MEHRNVRRREIIAVLSNLKVDHRVSVAIGMIGSPIAGVLVAYDVVSMKTMIPILIVVGVCLPLIWSIAAAWLEKRRNDAALSLQTQQAQSTNSPGRESGMNAVID